MPRFSRPFTRFSVDPVSLKKAAESPLRKSKDRFDRCSGLEISNGSALLSDPKISKIFWKTLLGACGHAGGCPGRWQRGHVS